MRPAWVATAALFLCCGSCEKASDVTRARDLVITYVPMKVGERAVSTEDMTWAMELRADDGRSRRSTITAHHLEAGELLELADGRPSRERITYRELTRTRTVDGVASDVTPPIVGKAYVIERARSGALEIYTEDGRTAPPPAERIELEHRNRRFGLPDSDSIERFFAARKWTANVEVALSPDDVARAGHELGMFEDVARLAALSFTLRKVAGAVAIFDTRLRIEYATPIGKVGVNLTGEVDLEIATGHLFVFDMAGPMTGGSGTQTLSGELRDAWKRER